MYRMWVMTDAGWMYQGFYPTLEAAKSAAYGERYKILPPLGKAIEGR